MGVQPICIVLSQIKKICRHMPMPKIVFEPIISVFK